MNSNQHSNSSSQSSTYSLRGIGAWTDANSAQDTSDVGATGNGFLGPE